MTRISIVDLEVWYRIGVPDEERSRPQRLLLTVEMAVDAEDAAASDRIEQTINYQEVANDLLAFGEGRSWRLLEKLVADLAAHVLNRYQPRSVTVEARKFVIPQARFVSVVLTKTNGQPG